MNALNAQMRAEITDAVTHAGREARVVALTGTGRAFCSGQDLSDGGNAATLDLERVLREEYVPMLRTITDCPVPTISAVNGPAAGAGANLALAADVVIAAEGAYFLQAFARIGLMPDAGGTWALPRQMGLAKSMGAALFAEPISARQASDWGMIWEYVSDEGFEAHWQAGAPHRPTGRSSRRSGAAGTTLLTASWSSRRACKAPAGKAAISRKVCSPSSRNAPRGSRDARARARRVPWALPARAGLTPQPRMACKRALRLGQ
jgi:2-(1,2-epoxy-1,2-dihydrophenyl)acetyl-CoA isomerase